MTPANPLVGPNLRPDHLASPARNNVPVPAFAECVYEHQAPAAFLIRLSMLGRGRSGAPVPHLDQDEYSVRPQPQMHNGQAG